MNFVRRMLYGRYGSDQLSMAMLVLYLALYFISALTGSAILNILSLAIAVITIFRMLSRNMDRRRSENARFLSLVAPIRTWVSTRRTVRRDKDHCYFKCPSCGQQLRVPKGKGKITVTCRACGTSFEEKS